MQDQQETPMNITDIQARLDALAKAMGEKGLVTPDISLVLKSHGTPGMVVSWGENEWRHFGHDDLREAFEQAYAWLAALPSPDARHRAEFLKRAASAVDYAAKHLPDDPIAAEVRASIVAGMHRLSENAIAALGGDKSPEDRSDG